MNKIKLVVLLIFYGFSVSLGYIFGVNTISQQKEQYIREIEQLNEEQNNHIKDLKDDVNTLQEQLDSLQEQIQ